ncbi:DUF4097 family beta strand repeat-containing protein [Brachybacterium sp. J153]|uniref:DUF4097 family beta strand repeat-containing protein n=1 Tax=Brachybacterium sp. J153 TaxID=3116488 RepID=UPI002E7A5481|nr:DUF4097 family beta strand repeat-containing protein [Brachybacterium sp. J153]MEE1619516.1 DUF4097 family beta strand repeat-containing protein [Brachybacterium sp. J153]
MTSPLVHEFPVDGPIDVTVQNLRGTLVLRAEHGTVARVELTPHGEAARALAERMRIRCEDGRLRVDAPADEARSLGGGLSGLFRPAGEDGAPLSDRIAESVRSMVRSAEGLTGQLDVTVVVPAGSRAVLDDGAGEIAVHGVLGRLEARTGAGDIRVERGAEERTRLSSGTGDLQVGELAGEASLSTGAGDVRVRRAVQGRLNARSGLGDVEISVAPGTAARLDLATGFGERDVRLTPVEGAGDAERTLEVEARTGKGDVRVMRAEG